ncbi:toxin-antitoxin system YwqK family antitoxin [Streptomyces sp. NPDC057499]|uniref:toxin-antitoxin system YwqK family antitoxin n=1 Tax=Streptomyces sp. NPDC057499 TaxID=3346150 RepID=UPI0036911B2E
MALPRIDIDDPEFEMDEGEVVSYQGQRFTGEGVEYQRGALVSLVTYRDGIEDGPSQEWYVDGTPRSEGTLRAGFPIGESKDWHPNGRLASRVLMSANGFRQLEITEWDENGKLTKEWRADQGDPPGPDSVPGGRS